MLKMISLLVLCYLSLLQVMAQSNTPSFPLFKADPRNPIIKYGDGFADASWNDPSLLKLGNQYMMYASAAIGITGTTKVKIYRLISSDGYSWTLSPSTPVLEPVLGTHYEGGTETPSVVLKDGVYHMYTTTYPPGNVPQDFTISHATSSDGIHWTMDTTPILESNGTATWNGSIVGEPGAMVYHDSIYVYFTGGGIENSASIQCIGLIKSSDGTHFGNPEKAVLLPTDVYPISQNYVGLSTPSALAKGDSIYLFTDVAQTIHGTWTQVALHQFKTDGKSGTWYHDSQPIHTKQDFPWTNETFYSEIRSITPLLDDDGRLRIWYAGNALGHVSGKDTTYHIQLDSAGKIHVDPHYWGIGTSEFKGPVITSIPTIETRMENLQFYPNPCSDQLFISGGSGEIVELTIVNSLGVEMHTFTLVSSKNGELSVSDLPDGMYMIRSATEGFGHSTEKLVIHR